MWREYIRELWEIVVFHDVLVDLKRCNWVFNEEQPDASWVVRMVNMQMEEFWKAKDRRVNESKRLYAEGMVRNKEWKAAVSDSIKINADGAYHLANGRAGIGVVCKNSDNKFVGGFWEESVCIISFNG